MPAAFFVAGKKSSCLVNCLFSVFICALKCITGPWQTKKQCKLADKNCVKAGRFSESGSDERLGMLTPFMLFKRTRHLTYFQGT